MKKIALMLMMLAFTGALAAQVFPEIKREKLGSADAVFEIKNGEAQTNLHALKRIEIGKSSAFFTVRNETADLAAPVFAAELFNRYGMRLAVLEADFRAKPVGRDEVRVWETDMKFTDLESVFAEAAINLPRDWREVRFVRLKFRGGVSAAMPDNQAAVARVTNRPAAGQPASELLHPRARPQIVKQNNVRPTVFAENKFGTSNIGSIACDAKWSNYGAYLQRVIDAVQIEWDRILTESRNYPGSGTFVAVKFVLNSEGGITRIVEVDNHSTEQGSRFCVSAITNHAPYGKWTDDMIAMLGKQQEMTFTFYYQ